MTVSSLYFRKTNVPAVSLSPRAAGKVEAIVPVAESWLRGESYSKVRAPPLPVGIF